MNKVFNPFQRFILTRFILSSFILMMSFSAANAEGLYESLKSDYSEFYQSNHNNRMFKVFAAGALMANSDIDQEFQDNYQDNIRSASTDDLSKTAKLFGEGKLLIPISILAMTLGNGSSLPISEWGNKTLRSFLTGAPGMLLMQRATGGSRPYDNGGSDWEPFEDSNGVSGHAFIGSIPFIVLAEINAQDPLIYYSAYALSGLAAWSRMNDDDHYLSQSILGWYFGYESAQAILNPRSKNTAWTKSPMLTENGIGVSFNYQWK